VKIGGRKGEGVGGKKKTLGGGGLFLNGEASKEEGKA